MNCNGEREMVPERENAKTIKKQSLAEGDTALKELLIEDIEYYPLLTLLKRFCREDGIQMFNRKLYRFESTIFAMCPDETSLCQAFATFQAAALQNSKTARKLAAMLAFFTREQLHPLSGALLDQVMQQTFSKLKPEAFEGSKLQFLINAANLIGDYFGEARLSGKKAHYLVRPLIQFMHALLRRNNIRAHQCLATQLMRNRRELFLVVPQELDELSASIRLRLQSTPSISNICLFVAADLCQPEFPQLW